MRNFLVALEDGKSAGDVHEQVMGIVRSHFRPEFLNRIDDVILFERLKKSDMAAIVEIQLRHLRKLLEERRISISLEDDAINWLADKGYDPAYGARPLKRVIQTELQDPLAEQILAGEIHDGMEVKVVATGGRLLLKGKVQVPEADNDDKAMDAA